MHRLQKWAAIALARFPGPYQRPRSVALTTRIVASGDENGVSEQICRHCACLASAKHARMKGGGVSIFSKSRHNLAFFII